MIILTGTSSSGSVLAMILVQINETIILDAICAPQNISYSKGVNLLNEARENLESLIDRICYDYSYSNPRMCRRNARMGYLNLAKCKNVQQKRYVKQSTAAAS